MGVSAVATGKCKASSSTRSTHNVKPKPKIVSVPSKDEEDEEDNSYTIPAPTEVPTDINEEANYKEYEALKAMANADHKVSTTFICNSSATQLTNLYSHRPFTSSPKSMQQQTFARYSAGTKTTRSRILTKQVGAGAPYACK
jgi:hypothetical protein